MSIFEPNYDYAYRIYEESRGLEWDKKCVYCGTTEGISVKVGVVLGEVSKMAVCTHCR